MSSPLFLEEDASAKCRLALAAAQALFHTGRLTNFTDPELIQARDPVGERSCDILFPATHGERAWLVPLPSMDSDEQIGELLTDTLPGYLAARLEPNPLFDYLEARTASILANSGTGIAIESTAIVIGSRSWRVKRPRLAIFMTALGVDAQLQRIRLETSIEHDLRKVIEPLLEIHRRAAPVAAQWTASGASGAVEATAYAIMRANDIDLAEVLTALEAHRRVEFRCGDTPGWSGWFHWRDFAICAVTEERQGIRLDGNRLFVQSERIPGSVLSSYEGGLLGRLVEHAPLPPRMVIEEAVQAAPDKVCITLKSSHLPIGADRTVGWPKANRRRSGS